MISQLEDLVRPHFPRPWYIPIILLLHVIVASQPASQPASYMLVVCLASLTVYTPPDVEKKQGRSNEIFSQVKVPGR